MSFATVLTVAESQFEFDNLAIRIGCVGTDPLACLRNKTAADMQAVNYPIPYPGAAAPPVYLYNPSEFAGGIESSHRHTRPSLLIHVQLSTATSSAT